MPKFNSRPKPCAICGKIMMVPLNIWVRKKYCSRSCRNISQSVPRPEFRLKIKCPICGTLFPVKPSESKRRICCSLNCSSRYRSNYPDKVWTEIECKRCKKKLMRRAYRVKNTGDIFCSNKCRFLYASENSHLYQVKLNCQICGREFNRQRFFVNVRKNARFCSRECLNKYNSLSKRRENNVNWTGGTAHDYGPNWHEQQRAARKRDGWHCKLCGLEQQKYIRLDVHHIVKFKSFGYRHGTNDNYLQANQLTNLITLCKPCHRDAERNPEILIHQLTGTNVQRQFDPQIVFDAGETPPVFDSRSSILS